MFDNLATNSQNFTEIDISKKKCNKFFLEGYFCDSPGSATKHVFLAQNVAEALP